MKSSQERAQLGDHFHTAAVYSSTYSDTARCACSEIPVPVRVHVAAGNNMVSFSPISFYLCSCVCLVRQRAGVGGASHMIHDA